MKTKILLGVLAFVMVVIVFIAVPPTLCKEEVGEETKQEDITYTPETENTETAPQPDEEVTGSKTDKPEQVTDADETEPNETEEVETEDQPAETTPPTEPEATEPPKQEETKPTEETKPKEESKPQTEPTQKKPTIDDMTLVGSFGFYKGEMDMSEIKAIYFQENKPAKYDESWNANVSGNDYIRGYRSGTTVYIVGEKIYANNRCNYMFAAQNSWEAPLWSNLKEIHGLELLDMSNATKANCMFYNCQATELKGIKYWNTSNLKSTSMMFAGCINLTELDIALWNVSKVEDFSGMFQGNSWAGDMKLRYLDVSKWNTSSATKMTHVFYGCAQLKEIPIDNWDVSKVTTFSHMFADCYSVENLNFSKWNTKSVKSFDALLNDCHALTIIDVSGLDTATCTQYSQMFEACTNLEKIIGIETWDVSSAGYYAFSETFHGCNKLKELNISNWKCRPDNIARMFKNCYELTTVDMSGFDMSNLEHITEFAMNCGKLTTIIGLENWNLENFDNVTEAFAGCPSKPQNLTETVEETQEET